MSFDLVFFGGTGDLTWRKLIPALFQSHRHGTLPKGGRIIGIGREDLTSEQYRERIWQRFESVEMQKRPTEAEFVQFSQLLEYIRLDLSRTEEYENLATNLRKRSADNIVLYLATSPILFSQIVRDLRQVGLNQANVRIVLEKPLGYDLESNKAINNEARLGFSESQIFRIDHYLGKPAVQNLFALRFGNIFFEPLWHREHIANIQITIAEELGVGRRGSFYDSTGALRDMVQNHALQLLCAIAMEPPTSLDADAIRDEKLKVLRSLKPWTEQSISSDSVRGQYLGSSANANNVLTSYRQEEGVDPKSQTETFVALRTEINNWRWAGVPFYLRTGKRMAESRASIVINFRPVPHTIFGDPYGQSNQLIIYLQPKDGLELRLMASGQEHTMSSVQVLSPVHLDLDFNKRFGQDRVGAYERLLLDVLVGRLNLFVRSDEQEEAWRWVESLMKYWENDRQGPKFYASGSWGPSAASAMIARDGYCWSEEC